ncbi:MAG: methyltransferase domain-containing protein [Ktedonobacteraceae bacterium]|nr:methyltransferase domain-containing protein [Ktedonobacteraceae bacterium]
MSSIHPSENSYILDQESNAEMARLIDQDIMITKHMGGLFPPTFDLSNVHDILDIACGPGGWAVEVAFTYPNKQVVGIDISSRMLNYARSRANVHGLKKVKFLQMDATGPLAFSDASFDFVNARGLVGFMWREAWQPFVAECFRITRPGGTIRLTELDNLVGITNSAALERLGRLITKVFHRQRRTFCDDENASHFGVTPMLASFLEQAGCDIIHEQPHMQNYSSGMEGHVSEYRNFQVGMKMLQSVLVKAGLASQEELDQLYQQMLTDMTAENFRGIVYFMSAIGHKPL